MGFLAAKRDAWYDHAKSSRELAGNPAERLTWVNRIAPLITDQAKQRGIAFARTILGPMPEKEKQQYLLETDGAMDLLDEWFPRDPRSALRLGLPGVQLKGVAIHDFLGFCATLDQDCMDALQNPVAKSVVRLYHKLHQNKDLECEEHIRQGLFVEVASLKLGLTLPETHAQKTTHFPKTGTLSTHIIAILEPFLKRMDVKSNAKYEMLAQCIQQQREIAEEPAKLTNSGDGDGAPSCPGGDAVAALEAPNAAAPCVSAGEERPAQGRSREAPKVGSLVKVFCKKKTQ